MERKDDIIMLTVSGSSMPCAPAALLILSPLTRPFNSFCAEYDKDSDNDTYDLETLKDFVQEIAYGMDGIEGEDNKPSLKSIWQTWKDFTAQFRRHHDPIPRNTTLGHECTQSVPGSILFSSTPERC
jgi:hypothetical protein